MRSANELTVLIVDDTAFYRKMLRACVEGLPDVRVVGTASDGRIALAKLEYLKPDFVVLDIEMPEMDGLTTLGRIRERWPEVGVVIVSGTARHAAEMTIQALAHGALDFVPKPGGGSADENFNKLREGLRVAVEAYRATKSWQFREQPRGTVRDPELGEVSEVQPLNRFRRAFGIANASRSIDAVGIAASTGGPEALMELIAELPASLPVPVFIAQHMPPMFTAVLAQTLDGLGTAPVCEATDGQSVMAGRVYLAPGGKNMVVRSAAANGARISLLEASSDAGCRPSADALFRSLASVYGGRCLGVVMTGMGNDGLEGARFMRERGARCITQNAESCVIYGMPRAVCEAKLSDESLPPRSLARRIGQLGGAG